MNRIGLLAGILVAGTFAGFHSLPAHADTHVHVRAHVGWRGGSHYRYHHPGRHARVWRTHVWHNGYWHRGWRGGFHYRYRRPGLHARIWYRGYWHRGWRGPRFGWWWVVGPSWYYYSAPVYPYPDPYVPPTIVQTTPAKPGPAPAQYWYYCAASRKYYPYVSTCPGGWRKVPAAPPPSAATGH